MNYKKEASKVLQKYMDENHIIFKDQREAERLCLMAFTEGYRRCLDFTIDIKKINFNYER